MLISRKSKNLMRLHTENVFFSEKIPFLRFSNIGVKPPFFKYSRLRLLELLKWCWASDTET